MDACAATDAAAPETSDAGFSYTISGRVAPARRGRTTEKASVNLVTEIRRMTGIWLKAGLLVAAFDEAGSPTRIVRMPSRAPLHAGTGTLTCWSRSARRPRTASRSTWCWPTTRACCAAAPWQRSPRPKGLPGDRIVLLPGRAHSDRRRRRRGPLGVRGVAVHRRESAGCEEAR